MSRYVCRLELGEAFIFLLSQWFGIPSSCLRRDLFSSSILVEGIASFAWTDAILFITPSHSTATEPADGGSHFASWSVALTALFPLFRRIAWGNVARNVWDSRINSMTGYNWRSNSRADRQAHVLNRQSVQVSHDILQPWLNFELSRSRRWHNNRGKKRWKRNVSFCTPPRPLYFYHTIVSKNI